MRFAYADPPYLGQARKHYSHDERCAEVDHAALLRQLREYDGWALSLSSPSLEEILHLARVNVGRDVVRVGGWFKPFAIYKPNVNPGYTWEPVVFMPGPRKRSRAEPTTRDWVEAEDVDCVRANISLKKGLAGAKPEPFCLWLPDLLGMTPDDTLDDLFPGTGAVTRYWEQWKRERVACRRPSSRADQGGRMSRPDVIQMVAKLAAMPLTERADFYANAVRLGASVEVLRILHDHCAPDQPARSRVRTTEGGT